jgi:hypothetical protein
MNNCEGCRHELIPGVRFATRDDGHRAIERCDTCNRYATDDEAFGRVERYVARIEKYGATHL